MSYKLEYRTICFGVDPASRQPTLGIEGAFFIPSYQRGYRWTADEVTKLLDDIWESTGKRYSLQPIVVKSLGGGKWELIDGQQRLTTLFLITAVIRDLTPASNGARKKTCQDSLYQMANPDDNVPERSRIVFDIRDEVRDFEYPRLEHNSQNNDHTVYIE